ncbi:MAG: Xyloglucanase [Phycisphaerae bacterium]|nr:Xyloglucanase [Phycisphaerae bacterium]
MTPRRHWRHAIAAAAAVLCPSVAAPAGPDWQELGPAPVLNGQFTGRVAAIACSLIDPDLIFVGGADGGVWRSTDGGATWQALTDQMPSSAIGALAIDPSDDRVIYAGTGEANFANHSRYGLGVMKSTDRGDSWTLLARETFAGRCISRIAISPAHPNTLYAGVTRAGGFPAMAAAKGHPQAEGPLGVFRSDDGGVTWTRLPGLPDLCATDVAIDPQNPGVIYAAVGHIFGSPDNGIYRSGDGGWTWTKLSGGLPAGTYGRISVCVAPSNPDRLYALITEPADAAGGDAQRLAAVRSDDAGATWSLIVTPAGLQASYGWYLSVVSVHPQNADTVFIGGLNLLRSVDGGTTLRKVTPPHVDLHVVTWDAAGRVLAGDDGGVHRSADLGLSWEALNDGLGLTQMYAGLSIHPADPHVVFAGLQDNGTVRRSDPTRQWEQVYGGDGGWTQVNPAAPQTVYVEFQGTRNVFRSLDGGETFKAASSGIDGTDRNCFLPPYLIDPADPNRMYFATHRVYRSGNGGQSWTAASGDLTNGAGAIRALAIAPSNPQTLYAATNDGNVLVSFDEGSTFTRVSSANPGWPRVTRELCADPLEEFTIYVAGAVFGQPHVRRSRDAGQTWETLDGDLPDVPVNVIAVDRRGAVPTIYAGSDAGVYRSVDDGDSWHLYGPGPGAGGSGRLPNAPVVDIRLDLRLERMVVATQGRGAWSARIAIPGDMNGDGAVNGFDIDPLVLAMTDPEAFAANYPDVDPSLAGDLNGDGKLEFFDVDRFVALLGG